ncbi:MAG: nucleoside hydrolase, partial [bacterium]
MHPITRFGLALCLVLATPACGMQQAAPARERLRILLDTDANNEVDDQHALAYMLFSGESFDVVGITVNRTRNGGDVEKQAEEA